MNTHAEVHPDQQAVAMRYDHQAQGQERAEPASFAPPSFDELCITRKKLLRTVEAKKAIRDRAQFEYDAALEELAAIKHALSACIERDL